MIRARVAEEPDRVPRSSVGNRVSQEARFGYVGSSPTGAANEYDEYQ